MEDSSIVTLTVFRFNPNVESTPRYAEYQVPWADGLSMLEAVRHVYEEVDGTLYFRNYHCSRGLCQACLLKINGKTQRSCHCILEKGAAYTVEPPEGYSLIRDLGVDFGYPIRFGSGQEVAWVGDGVSIESKAKVMEQVEVK